MKGAKGQKGVGMIEVLVALILLAIGVLGFAALQLRAVDATNEAMSQVQAMNLARDLTERIRVNRQGYAKYKELINAGSAGTPATCLNTDCDANQMAAYDVSKLLSKAEGVGLKMAILACQGVSNGRECVYVAWNKTTATDGIASTDCTHRGSYITGSTCLVMEAF